MHPVFDELSAALRTPAPWWTPYIAIARRLLDAGNAGSVADVLNDVRRARCGLPQFIPHSGLTDEPYEAFIARTGTVPTRDNLHDLFNGLAWLAFPETKRRLNVLQAEAIAALGISGSRGSVRDALTLFDENAALLQAPAPLVDALRKHDWKTLFVTDRKRWHSTHLMVFGHALLEKLMQPRKAITAHVWVVDSLADRDVAASLTIERLAAKPFLPLPVLGVPGWWRPNEDPHFYDDPTVFRPPRAPVE